MVMKKTNHWNNETDPIFMLIKDDVNYLIYFLFYVAFNSQGHIATGSLWVEEPVHTSWSRFCTVNHQASVSNNQLSNIKSPGPDSNWRPQRLKASTLTAT